MSTTKAKIGAAVASVGVLAAGYQAGKKADEAFGGGGSGGTAATATGTPVPAGASGTFTGSTESDRYGTLAVTVKVAAGKITDVTYTSTAQEGKSLSIEGRSTPILKSEAIKADSANLATVSGATFTSTKYKASLQAAIDKMASSSTTSSASPSPSSAAKGSADGTFTGTTETDRYGSLAVTVKIVSGKIADVTYTSNAQEGRSKFIEQQSTLTLKSEAVAANSADIATVSGATYTSTKYKASLQAALDKVG